MPLGASGGPSCGLSCGTPPPPAARFWGAAASGSEPGRGSRAQGRTAGGRAEQRTPKPKPPPASSPAWPRHRRAAGAAPRGDAAHAGPGPCWAAAPAPPHLRVDGDRPPRLPIPPSARPPVPPPAPRTGGRERPVRGPTASPAWALPAKEVKRQRRLPAANSLRLLKTPRWKRAWGRAAGVGVGAWGADAHGHRLPPARVRAGENKDLWVP